MGNKTALITGASTGIGKEMAFVLSREGYDLVLVARRTALLADLKSMIENETRRNVHVIAKDLSSPEGAQEVYTEVKSAGLHPEILVNNAGFGVYGEFTETDWVKEKQMIDLNITALVELTKLFLPDMLKAGRGKILNVASTAAFQPGPNMAVYYASKSFVLSFSEAIAEELSGSGVTVTALCPGPTRSEFSNIADMNDTSLFQDSNLPSAEEVAKYGYDAMIKGKRVAIHGIRNYILANSVRFTPRDLVTKAVRFVQRRKEK